MLEVLAPVQGAWARGGFCVCAPLARLGAGWNVGEGYAYNVGRGPYAFMQHRRLLEVLRSFDADSGVLWLCVRRSVGADGLCRTAVRRAAWLPRAQGCSGDEARGKTYVAVGLVGGLLPVTPPRC